jgi:hypothetical protein
MWNSGLSKALRWIFFIPIVIAGLSLIDMGIFYLNLKFFELSWSFWEIIFMLSFVGVTIALLPVIISMLLTSIIVSICPDKKIGGYIFNIFAILNFLRVLYVIWTIDIEFTGKIITCLILSTIVTITVAFTSITSAIENFE